MLSGREDIKDLKKHLSKVFDMKDLGVVKYCLGIEFFGNGKEMCQSIYIKEVLHRFGMAEARPVTLGAWSQIEKRVRFSR